MSAADLHLVTREEWHAAHPLTGPRLVKGLREVNIHHTVTPATGDPCADARTVERVLHSRNLDGYNWLVHPAGVGLELAGHRRGEHTENHNSTSIGISFIGNYDEMYPTMQALVAASRIINLLRMGGDLAPTLEDIRIQGHRDSKATACPGLHLYPYLRHIRWFAQMGY